jgi:hypothetical protein
MLRVLSAIGFALTVASQLSVLGIAPGGRTPPCPPFSGLPCITNAPLDTEESLALIEEALGDAITALAPELLLLLLFLSPLRSRSGLELCGLVVCAVATAEEVHVVLLAAAAALKVS